MHYEQAEFFRLMESIENQGGVHLDEAHENVFHTKLAGDHVKGIEIGYCNESALFEVPYTGEDGVVTDIRVCAVDDRMGLWPRFADAQAPGSGS
jgi:hypothetical protein